MIKTGRVATFVALALTLVIAAWGAVPATLGQSPEAGESAPAVLADREVFGFLPYWELSRASSIDFDTLTTLAWFGVEAGRDGHLVREVDGETTPGWAGWGSDEFAALRTRAQMTGVGVVLVVERFSWTTAGKRVTKKLLRDPDARARLANEITEAITAAGADGVNLDFEPLPQSVRGDFVRLVRNVRRSLDAVDPSLQLTFDLTPDVDSFPVRRLVGGAAADAAILMGYEYRTSDSEFAGSVAPLRDPDGLDLRESVQRALARAPADRIILALPWYGRAWSTKTDEARSRTRNSDRYIRPSTATYRVSMPRAVSAGRRYDRGQASAWSVYGSRACESCPLSWRQLWYDDIDSVRAKVGFAQRKGLRGVGIWALGYEGEHPDLWSALRYSLGGRPDGSAPTGTVRVEPASVVTERGGRPVVGPSVTLALAATDGPDGSGVAFVRVATRGQLAGNGAIRHGTTFPAAESVTVMLPGAEPVDDVFIPGAGDEADSVSAPLATPTPPPAPELHPVTIQVQWRDVAGNWSEPRKLPVLLEASTSTR